MIEIDFTEDKENFQWKGHGPLLPKEGSISVPAGFKLQTGLQLIPAAPVSALAMETRWGLLAAGTIHGFILYDYLSKKTVSTKWTVSQGKLCFLKPLCFFVSCRFCLRNWHLSDLDRKVITLSLTQLFIHKMEFSTNGCYFTMCSTTPQTSACNKFHS